MVRRPLFTNGIPDILAQAPTVAAAFGRWPAFALIIVSMLVLLALGLAAVLVPIWAVHLVR